MLIKPNQYKVIEDPKNPFYNLSYEDALNKLNESPAVYILDIDLENRTEDMYISAFWGGYLGVLSTLTSSDFTFHLQESILEYIAQDPDNNLEILYYCSQSRYLCMSVVALYDRALEFIYKQDQEMCDKAISIRPDSFMFIRDEFKSVSLCEHAVKGSVFNLPDVPKDIKEQSDFLRNMELLTPVTA